MRYSVFCMASTKGEPVSSLEMWGGQEETGNSAREAMLASSADRRRDPSLKHSLDPSNCFCCSRALCSLWKLVTQCHNKAPAKNSMNQHISWLSCFTWTQIRSLKYIPILPECYCNSHIGSAQKVYVCLTHAVCKQLNCFQVTPTVIVRCHSP